MEAEKFATQTEEDRHKSSTLQILLHMAHLLHFNERTPVSGPKTIIYF